jgi:hypothetical protein
MVTVRNSSNLLSKPGGAVLTLGSLSIALPKFAEEEMNRLGEKVLEDAKSASNIIGGAMLRNWPSEDPAFPMTKTLLLINEIGKTAGVSVPNEKGDAVPFGNKIVIPKSELESRFEHLYGKVYEQIVFEILKKMSLVKDYALKGNAGNPDTPMVGLTLVGAVLAERFQQIERDQKLIREATDAYQASQPK